MSRKQDGVKPWPSQRHLPEKDITLWQIDSAGAFDDEGNPLPRIRRQVEGSRAKAVAHRRSLLVELTKSASADPEQPKAAEKGSPKAKAARTTLATYIQGTYTKYSQTQHRPSTSHQRLSLLRRDVIPLLGKMTLAEANTPSSVTKLREYLDAKIVVVSKKSPVPRPLRPAGKNQVLLGLSSVLTTAADPSCQPNGIALIDRKVRIRLYPDDAPKAGSIVYQSDGMRMGQNRHKRLPDDVIRALWAACKDDLERVIVGLGLFGGCRISEACARVWSDVDFDKGRLHIWSSLCPRKKVVGPTKNSLSGWVPISDTFLGPLKRLKSSAGTAYLLEPGVPMSRSTVSWRYWRIAKRAGVVERVHNYHALRHSFCSRLADAGVPVQTIQKLARHKNIATTFGYIAPNEAEMQNAGKLLDL